MSADRIDLEKLKHTNPPVADAWYGLVMYIATIFLVAKFGDQLNYADRLDIAGETVLRVLPRIQWIKTGEYIRTVASRLAVRFILKRQRQSSAPLDEIADGGSDDPQFNQYAAAYASLCQESFKDDEAKRDAAERWVEIRAQLRKKDREFLDRFATFIAGNPRVKDMQKAFAAAIGWTEGRVNVTFYRIRARLKKSGQKRL